MITKRSYPKFGPSLMIKRNGSWAFGFGGPANLADHIASMKIGDRDEVMRYDGQPLAIVTKIADNKFECDAIVRGAYGMK